MAGFTYSTLTTAIQNYTEVGTSVLSSTITDQFIDNSELRIQRDVPIDADRKEVIDNLVASKDNIHVPAGTLFVRGLQVYTSTTAATGANSWLEKKDISYLREYDAAEPTTGTPKNYAKSVPRSNLSVPKVIVLSESAVKLFVLHHVLHEKLIVLDN